METVKKHLESVFNLVSTIPVSGQHTEVMATVRTQLRLAYKLVEELEADKESDEDGEKVS